MFRKASRRGKGVATATSLPFTPLHPRLFCANRNPTTSLYFISCYVHYLMKLAASMFSKHVMFRVEVLSICNLDATPTPDILIEQTLQISTPETCEHLSYLEGDVLLRMIL